MSTNKRAAVGLALLIALLGTAIPAEAAKVDATAARAACFKQANAAVDAVGPAAQAADKNSVGYDAYAQCCKKAGIRP